jgi:predicted DNA-binding protein
MDPMPPAITTSIRVQPELLDRADALIPYLGKLATAAASGELVRSDVLRIALVKGLEDLERKFLAADKPARKR